jgi:ubiquinone/menaquinone biosynthesis C-methylase UbiE
MSSATEPEELRTGQYKDATQLDARIELHRRFSTNAQGWPRWCFEQLDLPAEADLLEVGCGPAFIWVENTDRIPGGWRILLSDFSAGMLADADDRLRGAGHAFTFQQIDAADIQLPDSSFECVLANHMLYHVPDRPRALREIHRVLRPGGLLFATTLSGDTLFEMGHAVRTATARTTFQPMRMAGNFLLDNGAAQLEPYFPNVETRLYADALEITEAEPLLAYYRSMILDDPFREDELAAIGAWVEQQIARDGAFHVRKSAGVFRARKAA